MRSVSAVLNRMCRSWRPEVHAHPGPHAAGSTQGRRVVSGDAGGPSRRVGAFIARFFAALQYREFRQLWIANAFAQAAAWGLIVTRGWLIFDDSTPRCSSAAATFAALGPQFLVPPIVGVMADRMDRRKLLSWTYSINTIHNVVLLALALTGVLEIWMLIALSVVNGTARAAQMPTSQALSASLVPTRERCSTPCRSAPRRSRAHG